MKVNLFLPGAPKCGSTFLAGILGRSPLISLLPEKEIHFFCSWNKQGGTLEDYHSQFLNNGNDAGKEEYWLDASVTYWCDRQAPERIHEYNPECKILIVLRDPVEQVFSHYLHLKRQNFHCGDTKTASFEEAFERYHESLIGPVYYSKEVSRWKNLFGDRVMIVFFEELISGLEPINEIANFLFLENGESLQLGTAVDERRGVEPKSAFHEMVYRKIYRAVIHLTFRPVDKVIGWNRVLRLYGKLGLRRKIEKFFYNSRSPEGLDPRSKGKVLALIQEDLRRLPDVIGFEPIIWESYRLIGEKE